MPGKVADASLLSAIAFQEPQAEQALALIGNDDLYAPSLLAYELTSVARKKALRHPRQSEALDRALRIILSADIQWVEVAHDAILQLALGTGLTTYDATYLYVARTLGMPLLTFDDKLRAAMMRR